MGREEYPRNYPREVIVGDPTLEGAQPLPEITGVEVENFQLGLKVKLFNAGMRGRREELDLTQRELADEVRKRLAQQGIERRVSGSRISQLEGFYCFPDPQLAGAIAEVLGVTPQTIFPEWLKYYVLEKGEGIKIFERSVSPAMLEVLGSGQGPVTLLLSGPPALAGCEAGVVREEIKMDLERILESLPARERKVLELRFGLKGGEQMTLGETGEKLGITDERVRVLQEQALRRIRMSNRGDRSLGRGLNPADLASFP